MPYVAGRKVPVPQAQEPNSRSQSFPAPTGGWVSAKNLAAARMPFKLYGPPAEVLECWFPTETGIEVMGGSQLYATIATAAAFECESLFEYVGASSVTKMFAAGGGEIFDITTPVDNETPPAASVTGQATNYYSTLNFATAGGNYLDAVTGTDDPQLHDGTTWTAIDGASTPAITGVTTSSLSQVNAYRNRIYFVEGGTMNVWALPVDSIGGAAIQISLAGVFQLGGSVLFTATWSLDSGSGLDDKLFIMSTEGEIAVYQGSDPSNPADFSIVGVYSCPAPMGKNAFIKAGGNLLIATVDGLIPISEAVTKDKAAIGLFAVSRNIAPDWIFDARQRRSIPWEIVKWPTRQRLIISTPSTGDDNVTPPWCYVVNSTTGAWCKRPGWGARCMVLHDDSVFFGNNSGQILRMEVTGYDNGSIYYPTVVMSWTDLGIADYQKTVIAMRAQFVVSAEINPQLSVSTDYTISLPTPPSAPAISSSASLWDVGLWDVALWDVGVEENPYNTGWVSVNQSGYSIAPQLQMASGSQANPGAKLVNMSMLYEVGEIMI